MKLRFRVAPLAMNTSAASASEALAMLRVPPLTLVLPVRVCGPLSVRVPLPDFSKPPVPEMAPLRVTALLLEMVPVLEKVMGELQVVAPLNVSVAKFNVTGTVFNEAIVADAPERLIRLVAVPVIVPMLVRVVPN